MDSEINPVQNANVRVELDTLNAKTAKVKLKKRLLEIQEHLDEAAKSWWSKSRNAPL